MLGTVSVIGRPWTDVDGRVIEAEFVRVEGESVVLSMNGKEYPVPLARLSEADREFARSQAAGGEAGKPAAAGVAGEWRMGDTVITGQKGVARVVLPLPEDVLKEVAKGDRPHKELHLGLSLPEGYDPAKPQKFLWVWTPVNSPRDIERGSIGTINAFRQEANAAGWAVFATDTDIGYPDDEAYSEIVGWALEQMAGTMPAFEDSIFAVGGFSGGAKNATISSGALAARGLKVVGIFMAGSNEDRLEVAQESFKAKKSAYKETRVFFSNGKTDGTASVERVESVVEPSVRRNGAKETKIAPFEGGHQLHREHIGEALRWFEEGR